MRGYCGIGIESPKRHVNIGTLWRSAYAFGASFIFTIGARYTKQASDTTSAWKHLPLFHYETLDAFLVARPMDCRIVGIETTPTGTVLSRFVHPERAIYLLGSEDHGLSAEALQVCNHTVRIPAAYCLNVATAGSIVLYDRSAKEDRFRGKGFIR